MFILTLAMGTVLTGVEFALTDQKTIFSGVAEGYTDIVQAPRQAAVSRCGSVQPGRGKWQL